MVNVLKNPSCEKIEDTYAEAFNGICCRVIVTADDEETLKEQPSMPPHQEQLLAERRHRMLVK